MPLADAHDGTLTAASPGKDQGSTFTVQLPAVAAPERQITSVAGPSHPIPASAVRVLLVEDHADTLRVMARLVGSLGYEVHVATTVEGALALAEEHRFDLLISDLGLPDGSGYELMRRLNHRRAIKAIALSGYGMEDDMRKAVRPVLPRI